MTKTYLPALVISASLVVACGSAERPAPRDSMTIDSHMSNSSTPDEEVPEEATEENVTPSEEFVDILASGSCENDAVALDCKVMLPVMNGTKNCFVGTQVCFEGAWTNCMTDDDAQELLSSVSDT